MKCKQTTGGRKHGRGALPAVRQQAVKAIREGQDVASVATQNGQLKLFTRPPYSPQLNPDEPAWAHVKRQVSRRLVQSKDEMKRLALGALRRIQKLPELVKSIFHQPECRYASI